MYWFIYAGGDDNFYDILKFILIIYKPHNIIARYFLCGLYISFGRREYAKCITASISLAQSRAYSP